MQGQRFGPLVEKFQPYLEQELVGASPVSFSPGAELYHSTMFGTKEDEKYFMVTKDGLLVDFGISGMPVSISKKAGGNLETVLTRDGQGNYFPNRAALPANGISDNPALSDNQLSAQLIDYIFNKVETLPDDSRNELNNRFRGMTGNRVLARFKDFRMMVDESAIIPDFNSDYHVPVISTMEGCAYDCLHCPIGGGIVLYGAEKIKENLERGKQILANYHQGIAADLHEGFINSSDILWHKVLKKSDMDPLEIVALYKKAFPHVEKLGTFFGVRNTNRVVEQNGIEYLSKLMHNGGAKNRKDIGFGKGITRAYIGIETGHDLGARLLEKPEGYDDKVKAVNSLKEANIAVKEIIQAGVFGRGFYKNEEDIGKPITKENFVTWKEAADKTIDLVLETAPYRIMISEFLPLKGVRIQNLIDRGRIIPYEDAGEINDEVAYIKKKLQRAHDSGKIRWQGMSGRNMPEEAPIEPNYEQFVEGRKKLRQKKE